MVQLVLILVLTHNQKIITLIPITVFSFYSSDFLSCSGLSGIPDIPHVCLSWPIQHCGTSLFLLSSGVGDVPIQDVERNVTSGNLLTHSQPLTIGSYKNNSSNVSHHFEGSITNFAVFSGDKTSNASTHYNDGTPYDATNEDDLQGYWKMREGSGTTVTDLSGEGNDGTIDGASWITVKEI